MTPFGKRVIVMVNIYCVYTRSQVVLEGLNIYDMLSSLQLIGRKNLLPFELQMRELGLKMSE